MPRCSARAIHAAELGPCAASPKLLTCTSVSYVRSRDAPHVALAISVDDLEQSTARCGEVLFRRRGHPEQKAGQGPGWSREPPGPCPIYAKLSGGRQPSLSLEIDKPTPIFILSPLGTSFLLPQNVGALSKMLVESAMPVLFRTAVGASVFLPKSVSTFSNSLV
jgi:hypothetical protein